MVFKYEIGIISYNRADIIREKTIKLLKEHSIDPKCIRIFLETEELKNQYINSIGDEYNYTIHGQQGMANSRNAERRYYHEEVADDIDGVLLLDDDVEKLNELIDGKLYPVKDLHETLLYMFETTKEKGYRLFGPCAYNNAFFMKDKVSTNLKFICGCFHGLIIDKNKPLLQTEVDQFEDSLFTIEHFKADGGVVRFDKYSLQTKFWEKKGGMCDIMGGMDARIKNMNENAEYMANKYPGIVRIFKKKKGNDIRLNSRYKI